ncbi:MAG: cytochrome C oxidase subunit IV family protein [Bacteroidia bacterium]|jgi:cytochrome c oxidase subunit 4|nr:cytochrome C oxidase subunit IV family protein [Bacteroidia bacterium]MCC6769500.1 cytochrome C oxidase subunit IV family protein [Bacteroidia bacterium]
MIQEIDQSFQYSQPHARTPEQSRAVRKKILMVTLLLSAITIFEVAVGIIWSKTHVGATSGTWQLIKYTYIVLTLIKAGYIVLVFMHLGDESKSLRTTILLPFILIIYFIWIMLIEGNDIVQYLQSVLK